MVGRWIQSFDVVKCWSCTVKLVKLFKLGNFQSIIHIINRNLVSNCYMVTELDKEQGTHEPTNWIFLFWPLMNPRSKFSKENIAVISTLCSDLNSVKSQPRYSHIENKLDSAGNQSLKIELQSDFGCFKPKNLNYFFVNSVFFMLKFHSRFFFSKRSIMKNLRNFWFAKSTSDRNRDNILKEGVNKIIIKI